MPKSEPMLGRYEGFSWIFRPELARKKSRKRKKHRDARTQIHECVLNSATRALFESVTASSDSGGSMSGRIDQLVKLELELEREACAVVCDGYAWAIVEVVERNGEAEIQVNQIPWDRIYFDPHSRKHDFTDATSGR